MQNFQFIPLNFSADLFGNGGAKVFGSAATSSAGGPFSRQTDGAFSSRSGGPGSTDFAGRSSGMKRYLVYLLFYESGPDTTNDRCYRPDKGSWKDKGVW